MIIDTRRLRDAILSKEAEEVERVESAYPTNDSAAIRALERLERKYAGILQVVEEIERISVEFKQWKDE